MISFSGEHLFSLGSIAITNTIIDTTFVDALLFGGTYLIYKKASLIPSAFQNIVEMIVEGFYSLTESIAPKLASVIFPYFMTFFLFILLSNWSGLIPGFSTIGLFKDGEFVPFFRATTSDINTTFALAIISAVATHALSIKTIGIKDYIGKFVSWNPLNLFIGLLELISEITKPISLSFRLFGNIVAGEAVLATMSALFAFLLPLPFVVLEIIVGLVQALVFSMLTMAFMGILATPHHQEKEVNS